MQKENGKTIVAAFDFDGTITDRDTTFYFLLFSAGFVKSFFYFFVKIPSIFLYLIGKRSRQETKEGLFAIFFKGMTLDEVKKIGRAFASVPLLRRLKKEALERIAWHQEQGHRCVLISASLDVYLEPWGRQAGFSDILCSRLKTDAEGRVSGALEGLNCRNHEKVRRLKELLGPLEQYEIYAYGDSDGDKELLDIADHSFFRTMPNPSSVLTR